MAEEETRRGRRSTQLQSRRLLAEERKKVEREDRRERRKAERAGETAPAFDKSIGLKKRLNWAIGIEILLLIIVALVLFKL